MSASVQQGLEEYLSMSEGRRRAEWEQDAAFVALAMTVYRVDMEGSALGRESNRMRMRLRYEGYRLLPNAKAQVEALHNCAAEALKAWGITS